MTIFVVNLSCKTDDNSLRIFFSSCGEFFVAKYVKDDDGNNKGFGFFNFLSKEDV